MGFSYSLCLISKRNESELLIKSLLPFLDSRSRSRFSESRWAPESESTWTTSGGSLQIDARGIAGIKLEDGECSNSYCLSLFIQLERELEHLFPDHRFTCFDHADSFGCMWTSVFAGSEYIKLEMTAATSGMSQAIRQSKAIHAAWITIARRSNALFAYINIEEQTALQLFPRQGNLMLPEHGELASDGSHRFSVDHMVRYLLDNASE
ncbi:MAG: hypothetical protein ACOVNL_07550 [Prochlorococcaceae cyanobacterium]|jgi:hypothetical protein